MSDITDILSAQEGIGVDVEADVLKGAKGDQGDQGIQGEQGYTPQKGTDYFTEQEQQDFKEDVKDDVLETIAPILNNKANIEDIPNVASFITKDVNNLTNYYTKTENDNLLNTKANATDLQNTNAQVTSNTEAIQTINTNLTTKADKTEIPTDLSELNEDTTHRVVTDTEKASWNAKYDKPSDGIPKTDLASDVQTSLGKADTALQEHQDISGKVDKVVGKSLISDTEIERLANVDNYDDSEVKQDINNIQDEQETQNINITDLINTVNAIKNMGCIVTYTNKDDNREIFLKKMINKGQTLAPPDESELSLNKRDFNGWILNDNLYEYDSENQGYYYEGTSLTDAIQSLTSSNEDVYVYGSFEFYMVSIEGGTITTSDERTVTDGEIMVKPNTKFTMHADVPENMYFDKWIDNNGNTYTLLDQLTVTTNKYFIYNFKAIFSNEPVENNPLFFRSVYSSDVDNVAYVSNKCYLDELTNKYNICQVSEFLDDNFIKSEWGFILASTDGELTTETEGVTIVKDNNASTKNNLLAILNRTFSLGSKWDGKLAKLRIYAKVITPEGENETIYSDDIIEIQK